jgi:uncharacterized membrane protein YgdD (TMEM256/DUF423 family)
MLRRLLIIASIFGGLAVVLGAFGAHGLKKITNDDSILHSYQTAVQYQLYHALALFVVAMLMQRQSSVSLKWAGICFVTGIALFSGSLYLITYLKINGLSTDWAGPVTPIGGLFFVTGWVFLLIAAIKYK